MAWEGQSTGGREQKRKQQARDEVKRKREESAIRKQSSKEEKSEEGRRGKGCKHIRWRRDEVKERGGFVAFLRMVRMRLGELSLPKVQRISEWQRGQRELAVVTRHSRGRPFGNMVKM